MQEIWKDVKGYEGLYQVSNLGRVKSLTGNKKNYGIYGKILKGINNRNYLRVSLSKNGKPKIISIHRLVAETFIPNPNNYPYINHKDENPSNNCVDNLEWCTPDYNTNYGSRNKKISTKLTNNYKMSIKIKCLETDKIFLSLNDCSRQMNLKLSNIWAQLNNKNRTKSVKGYHFKYMSEEEVIDERDKYKSLYQNEKDKNDTLKRIIKEVKEYLEGTFEMSTYTKSVYLDEESIEEILDLLKEVK